MGIFSRRKSTGTDTKTGSSQRAAVESESPTTPGSGRTPITVNPASAGLPEVDQDREKVILECGGRLIELARKGSAGVLSTQFWSDKLMDWAMKDEAFKVQFFRFVDCYPALKTPDEIHSHLVDFLSQPGVTPPPGMDLMTKAGGLAKGLFTGQMTKHITSMAQKFIVGEDAASSVKALGKLWGKDIAFTVDLLGESCVSERVADSYLTKYMDLVENLPDRVAAFASNPTLESDHIGPIPRVNVSIKLSSLYWDLDPIAPEYSTHALMDRLGPILEAAGRNGVLLNFDIEQAEFKDLTLDIFEACCEKYDFPAGLALQAYLRSGCEDAQRVIDWAHKAGRQITVRLVKGAYWDYETINAEQRRWPVPVWSRKHETDACFERMTEQFLQQTPRDADAAGVKLALGSHNARSIANAMATARGLGLPDSAVECQMLHGMGDPLKAAAVELGWRVREYAPVGELLAGMAYFVRRLLENTSNESWLRAGFSDNAPIDTLLANPATIPSDEPDPGISMIHEAPRRHGLSPAIDGLANGEPFFNEPWRDFANAGRRAQMAQAIADAPSRISSGTQAPPSARIDDRAALDTWLSECAWWGGREPQVRSACLLALAESMRGRRDELAAVLVTECGFTWRAADAEVCDAIDACELFARESMPLFSESRAGRFIGELNQRNCVPLGPAVVLPPWNRPLSGLSLMAGASLVCGNPTLAAVNPSQSGLAALWEECWLQATAGISRKDGAGAYRWVETADQDATARLIAHPGFNLVATARPHHLAIEDIVCSGVCGNPNRARVRRLTYDFAQPSTIVVDSSADLGEAITATIRSAFGQQGQAFGSCRTCIVVGTAYEPFVSVLCEAVAEKRTGDPCDPATTFGPMALPEQAERVTAMIAGVTDSASLELAGTAPAEPMLTAGGNRLPYVGPHVFTGGTSADSPLAFSMESGPVLAIIHTKTIDEALSAAAAVGYRHTSAFFGRKPAHIAQAQEQLAAAHVSINRAPTDARIARQAIGIMYGTTGEFAVGSGAELSAYVRPVAVCENTMRRGFAPNMTE
ncbi:MAG: aldehyde dehydrogenase family protein [Planctomycetes bacterium]|nr:aldehyde dehydrogenase family protein [Planctomycetota bacterium]NOG55132.1 bifunctional proline dehydrogenase/L-glutamate gamma-semialdehyde dehydrogenase [Planctomycetota bacterium]